jgi:hypothetical protein
MPDESIRQMPSASTLTGSELVPLVQGGVNVQCPLAFLATALLNNLVKCSPTDLFPGTLTNKIVAGSNITLTVLMPGTNELLRISATGGGGPAIGSPVTGGTSTAVLYVDSTGNLAQSINVGTSPGFQYDPTSINLTVISDTGNPAITGLRGAFSGALGYFSGAVSGFGGAFSNGVISVVICSDTAAITYTAGNPPDWAGAPPVDVWVALDRLAAALTLAGFPP